MINKYLIIVIFFISLWACDEIPNDIIEEKSANYSFVEFESPSEINQNINSTLNFSISFNDAKDIKSVSYQILDKFNDIISNGELVKSEDNNNIFSSNYKFTNDTTSGSFTLVLTVLDILDQNIEVLQHNFKVISKTPNSAPVLSNLIAPDSVQVQNPKSLIKMSIDVNDANGLKDVTNVYFIVTKPDGTSSGNKVSMLDDGETSLNGDETASDGTFTLVIEITPSNDKGKYKFEFFASDKSNAVSQSITHFIEIY